MSLLLAVILYCGVLAQGERIIDSVPAGCSQIVGWVYVCGV